jgi:hypothetical protein
MKNRMGWVVVACATVVVGCMGAEVEEPPLATIEQGLVDCSQCTPSSSCSMPCADGPSTVTCAAYECNYNDPCDADAAIAIEGRRIQLGWSCPSSTLTNLTAGTSGGKYRSCSQGRIVKGPSSCAFGVPNGPVLGRYFTAADAAAVRSAVGFPIGAYGSTGNQAQRFQHGFLAPNGTTLAAIVGGASIPATERNALVSKWASHTSTKAPIGDTVATTGGWYNTSIANPYGFDTTFAVRAGTSTAYAVRGAIQDHWISLGGTASTLGWPTSDELCLDGGCGYVYSNFQTGHIRWSGGGAKVVAGQVPTPAGETAGSTFRYRLSGPLVRTGQAPDSDGDGLDDDREKQLAFLAAPRIFWDEGEEYGENQDFVRLRRLDLVQVRPHAGPSGRPVSKWAAGTSEFVKIRFAMVYPRQDTHIGDSELVEVRMSSLDQVTWDVMEIVYSHHGEAHYQSASSLYTMAIALPTALKSPYLWLAADEDGHGSWPGEGLDSDSCHDDAALWHHCFSGQTDDGHDGTLRHSLVEGDYWWFDSSRDVGEPETLRLVAWPPEGRGASATVPQIRRTANTLHHFVENDTGHGAQREYIEYGPAFVPEAEATCGWKCPAREDNGWCAYAPGPDDIFKCDGGGVSFPSMGPHTTLFPAGAGTYPKYGAADFTYQLWGLAGRAPFYSGNAARHDNALASASSEWAGGGYPAFSVNDGDRRGVYWGASGGWNDNTPNAPDSLRIFFVPTGKLIREIDVFTVQDNYTAPVEPTPAMTFTQQGIRDFLVQYCPVGAECLENGSGWQTVPGGNVVGNNKVWRQFTFPAVNARGIRLHITGVANAYSRVVELEAWE